MTRHRQQIPQGVAIKSSQASEDEWIPSIVVGQIVGVGRVLEQRVPVLEVGPNDQRVRFGRRMRRQRGHEAAANFQNRRPVIPDCGFNTREREAD
jgi:hypothetical protein